jgi:REP element-mobilizing transposase RayT
MSIRRLPHLYPEGRWLFLTWHLRGALRPSQFPPPHRDLSGETFVLLDRVLDAARTGPLFLRQDAIASLVANSLDYGVELGHYELASYVIMANHVHTLLLPKVEVSKLMKSLKGFTAREANLLLGRTGIPFWQKESYDHWVRDEAEWSRIAHYIENNPVKAGLVPAAEHYRWSSAFEPHPDPQ